MHSVKPDRFDVCRPFVLGGLKRKHPLSVVERGIAQQWREFLSRGGVRGRVGNNVYGVMCGSDATGVEYLCGVEVDRLGGALSQVEQIRVPHQRYAVFYHHGRQTTLRTTWSDVFEWLSDSPYEWAHAPDFELYRPGASPLCPLEGIEVWVGVVPRGQRSLAVPQTRGFAVQGLRTLW